MHRPSVFDRFQARALKRASYYGCMPSNQDMWRAQEERIVKVTDLVTYPASPQEYSQQVTPLERPAPHSTQNGYSNLTELPNLLTGLLVSLREKQHHEVFIQTI